MADDITIQVHGIKEFQRALTKIEKALGPELRKGLNEAADIVARAARPLFPHVTGNAQAALKVGSTQRGANLKVGGQKAPYAPWLDFGGRVGKNNSVTRPFIKGGRYVYPTLARKRPEVIEKLEEVLARLAREAGF